MGRHTGNRDVVTKLQKALEDFLADQRTAAEKDPEWKKATAGATKEEVEEEVGCGCEDCRIASQLLGNIY